MQCRVRLIAERGLLGEGVHHTVIPKLNQHGCGGLIPSDWCQSKNIITRDPRSIAVGVRELGGSVSRERERERGARGAVRQGAL